MPNQIIDRYLIIAARRIDPAVPASSAQQALQSLRATLESGTQSILAANPHLRPEEAALEAIFANADPTSLLRVVSATASDSRMLTDYLSMLRERLAGIDAATLETTLVRAREEVVARARELQQTEGSYAEALLRAINIHLQSPEIVRLTSVAETTRRTTTTTTTQNQATGFTQTPLTGQPGSWFQGFGVVNSAQSETTRTTQTQTQAHGLAHGLVLAALPVPLPPDYQLPQGFTFLGYLPHTATPSPLPPASPTEGSPVRNPLPGHNGVETPRAIPLGR